MAVKTVSVVLNGQTYELTLNPTTGNYEKTITAPGKSSWNLTEHYYPITLKAVDMAGNETIITDKTPTLGNSLKLKVKEKQPPVSTITAPTEGERLTNSTPTVTWKITDNDSGVNPETIGITIDSGNKITSGITKTPISGGYMCSFAIKTPLGEGSHIIKVDAQDFDGNSAIQRTVSIVVDTIPPVLSVKSPTNNLVTNQSKITVSGTTNDVTSNPCKVTVKLNSGSPQNAQVQSNGDFSISVTLQKGTNTIVVTSTDLAGKSTTISRTVVLDLDAPTIQSVTISKNPVVVGETFTISAKITD